MPGVEIVGLCNNEEAGSSFLTGEVNAQVKISNSSEE
jgi:hypothetical protein